MEFEKKVMDDLHKYLMSVDRVDEHLPECPDVEAMWPSVAEAYVPDGVREFTDYPVVSLGWVMFVGMALALYWDVDWEKYGKETGGELYRQLRDAKGYDNLDDYVLRDILKLDDAETEAVSKMVGECAARTLSMIQHSGVESGTPLALETYMAALHALFTMGVDTELNALGYHMRALSQN